MKIQSSYLNSFIKTNKLSNQNYLTKYQTNNLLSFDTVSFSAKQPKVQKKENHVKNGVQIGKDIYEMLKNGSGEAEILAHIKETAPNLNILDINALWQYGINPLFYASYLQSTIGEDFTPQNMQLFIRVNEGINNDMDKLLRAMDIAHEYTHYSQVNSGEDYEFLKRISNNNKNYAGVVTGLGDFVFSNFDTKVKNMCTQFAFGDAEFSDKFDPIPKEKRITKQALLESQNMKNEAVFTKIMSSVFDDAFAKVVEIVIRCPERTEPYIHNTVVKISQNRKELEKLRQDVKAYCHESARKEKEARTTESELAKKVLKISSSINYDVYPLYYELLERALK